MSHDDERNRLKAEADVLARRMQGMPSSIALDAMLLREAEIYQQLELLTPPTTGSRQTTRRKRPGVLWTVATAVAATGFFTTTRILVFVGVVALVAVTAARRTFRR